MHRDQPLPMRRHRYVAVSTRLGRTHQKARKRVEHHALPLAPRVETQRARAGKVPSRGLHRTKPNPSSGPPQVYTITAGSTRILRLHPFACPSPQETLCPFSQVHILRNRCGSHVALLDSITKPIPTLQTHREAPFLSQR